MHDRACSHGGLVAALTTLIALDPSAVLQAMDSTVAARATKAVGPADLRQGFLTLGLRSIALLELWEGKPLLELNGVASHDQSGTSV